jgi:predicted DCC family thiol-disulfide oxidoreductase YuxK
MDYVPYQQRAAVAGLPPITDEALDRAMHLVLSDGSVHAGAQALPLMLDRLPAGAVLKALFRIPGIPWLADRVYAWVAANRRRLAGSCGVRGPGPGLLAGPRDPGRFRNSQ